MPGQAFQLLWEPSTYILNDGSSWQSGAGSVNVISTLYRGSAIANGLITYDFAPLFGGRLFQNTDFDSGDHSAQGTLGWAGDVFLVASPGSTVARFAGATTILSNTATSYGQPRFNFYSASVGNAVYFEQDFTIQNGTWQLNTFGAPFSYGGAGYVDFTQVVPEPRIWILFPAGAALIAMTRRSRSRETAPPGRSRFKRTSEFRGVL